VRISKLAREVAGSETLAITARSQELKRQGIEVISFAAGEPDFDTPEHIKDAARRALDEGYTKYTAAAGAPELREAIAEALTAAGVVVAPSQVVVTAGAKQALYLAFQALLEPGDEVLIPSPYWVSFPEQVRLSGGVPVLVPTRPELGFVPSRAELQAALTPRTRGLVLNTPCNPTGAVYPGAVLQELMELAAERDLWVVSDETYSALTYSGHEHVPVASLSEDARGRTVVTSSFSKTYSMTGWRVGFMAAPEAVAAAAGRLVSHTTSNVSSLAQRGALAALQGPAEALEAMRAILDQRRRAMLEGLRAIPALTCPEPHGAFYAFPNVESYLGRSGAGGKIVDSAALARYLLDEARVAVVPGAAFGAPGHLRFSYATGLQDIERGLGRARAALEALD
jgi:aspartate aminotransferase